MRESTNMLINPIIPGFYPDPSICRVEEDFYLVTSSFALFPGVPLFHSRDLVHWTQIANILDRPSQLQVTADSLVAGIMAPTLRYREGEFCLVVCNISGRGNMLVTANDPRGPWSDPIWLEDVPGIDASLFFDDDGRTYVMGTGHVDAAVDGMPPGQGIWVAEFDWGSKRVMGERRFVWQGALRGAASPEAPHIYRKDGFYYLLIAEGGTEHHHAVTIARSRTVLGDYEGYVGNPILTHRHLGKQYPFCNMGHADLVQLADGTWYAVLLGSRLIEGYHKNLGRESFAVPVTWEEGWPVFSPGTGRVEECYPAPVLSMASPTCPPIRDDFDGSRLGLAWVSLGTPRRPFHTVRDGALHLSLRPLTLYEPLRRLAEIPAERTEWDELAFLGQRQTGIRCRVTTQMRFSAQDERETAGLALVQATNHQLRLERSRPGHAAIHPVGEKQEERLSDREADQSHGEVERSLRAEGLSQQTLTGEPLHDVLSLVLCTSTFSGYAWGPHYQCTTTQRVLAQVPVRGETLQLGVEVDGQRHVFLWAEEGEALQPIGEPVDGSWINPESIGGMIGTVVGVFASSHGEIKDRTAIFDWFDYENRDR